MILDKRYKRPNFTGRRFVMGDVHGGFLAMKHVLDEAGFDYNNDLLIQLGDVSDGWPETKEVIDELLKIKNLVYLLGNHDEWSMEYYNGDMYNAGQLAHVPKNVWFVQGGESTIDSLGEYEDQDPKYLEFFKSGKMYYALKDEDVELPSIFAHGNIPSKAYNIDKIVEVGRTYEFIWDRWLISEAARKRNNQKWVDDRFENIYLGHSQIQYLMPEEEHQGKPQRMCNLWAMDTGAAYSGKVSMMDIDTKMLYQSDYVCKYYPDHPGRNGVSYNTHLKNGGEPR